MGAKPRPPRVSGKRVTARQLAAYRKLYTSLSDAERARQLALARINGYLLTLRTEYQVGPGQAFDMWGDGRLKPIGDCAPLPQLG